MQKKIGYLEKLRTKPLAYRRRFAFLVSAGITAIIVIFWIISTVSNLTSSENVGEMTASASSSLSAFSIIGSQFSEIWDNSPFGHKSGSPSLINESQPSISADESASTSNQYLVQ